MEPNCKTGKMYCSFCFSPFPQTNSQPLLAFLLLRDSVLLSNCCPYIVGVIHLLGLAASWGPHASVFSYIPILSIHLVLNVADLG